MTGVCYKELDDVDHNSSQRSDQGDGQEGVLAQNRVINQLFGLLASRELASLSSPSKQFLQYNR